MTQRNAASQSSDDSSGLGRYEAAEQFLSGLFRGLDTTPAILIWTVRRGVKRSHWPVGLANAARLASGFDAQTNVYIGCGWRHQSLGTHARGAADDIAGIPALWLDLDVAGPGHTTKAYPPSFEDARALVDALPLRPTTVVNTGGGLHLWWRLREPWAFKSEGERSSAADLLRDWEATCRHYAVERGWTIDSVHDLPRVLRVPGSYRAKPDCPPLLVAVERDTGATYSADDFRERLVISHPRGRQAQTPVVGPVVLRVDASPPAGKVDLLAGIEPMFARSMAGKRTDMRDSSPSAYDLSVATYAAQAGWTDQEIADLLIYRRRRAGQDVAKALRLDYITDRIAHARAGTSSPAEVDTAQTVAEMATAVDRGSGPTELLAYLSDSLGLDVLRWTQTTRHEAFYELHIGGSDARVVVVGNVANVTSQKRFADAVYSHTGKLIGPFRPAAWAQILRALGQVVEVVESASREGSAEEWIDRYADTASLGYDATILRRCNPFVDDGSLHVHAGDFRAWLDTHQAQKLPLAQAVSLLRLAGFYSRQMTARDDNGKPIGRHYWCRKTDNSP